MVSFSADFIDFACWPVDFYLGLRGFAQAEVDL